MAVVNNFSATFHTVVVKTCACLSNSIVDWKYFCIIYYSHKYYRKKPLFKGQLSQFSTVNENKENRFLNAYQNKNTKQNDMYYSDLFAAAMQDKQRVTM
jgi:hypothetical protein